MASIQKVVLVGAQGQIGTPILEALLEAKYDVTVFTRPTSTYGFPSSVKVAKVDYNDLDGLTTALKGQDALISAIAGAAIGQEKLLVDAAIAAGVKRILPSQFGSNLTNPKTKSLPVFAPKVEVQDYLEQKTKGTQTTYALITNGAFLDWGIEHNFVIDVSNKRFELVDGGETPFTGTPLPLVAKGTVAVLQHLDETANRAVFLQGITLTQKKLLEIAQKVTGKEGWQVETSTSETVEKQAWEKFKADPANVLGWIAGFLKLAVFGSGVGSDYTDFNDNKLLGLKEITEQDVEGYVKKAVQ